MMKKKYASILLALIIAGSCLAEEITLNGADGFALVADYYAGSDGGAGVILMHQCNGERSMYQELGALLAGQGVHVLAMDFRGYGTASLTASISRNSGINRRLQRIQKGFCPDS